VLGVGARIVSVDRNIAGSFEGTEQSVGYVPGREFVAGIELGQGGFDGLAQIHLE
jgi:hypothetical protein